MSRTSRTFFALILCATAFIFFCLTADSRICLARDDGLAKAWEQFSREISPSRGKDSLHGIWEWYVQKKGLPARQTPPGRCIGADPALAGFMRQSGWQYRATSYELYFSSPDVLARSVYGLALHSGDVDRSMPLERFVQGVRGFHYNQEQICAWLNAVLAEQTPVHTDEERRLIFWLMQDGVVTIQNGTAAPGGVIHHVLGAAPGKKRSFDATLVHERLHVLWDEDPSFARQSRTRWAGLTETERQAARRQLAAYAQSNEAQLIEEWAVKQAELLPGEQRKKLVGL